MENNNFDNIPEKFQETPPAFGTHGQATYNNQPPEREPEMSVGDWIITILLMIIPCVGLIMLIVWAASNENKTRRNFARAYLIFIAAAFVLSILFGAAVFGALFSALAPLM